MYKFRRNTHKLNMKGFVFSLRVIRGSLLIDEIHENTYGRVTMSETVHTF